MQERNKIPAIRMEEINIVDTYRQTAGERKYRTDEHTDLHTYKKERGWSYVRYLRCVQGRQGMKEGG